MSSSTSASTTSELHDSGATAAGDPSARTFSGIAPDAVRWSSTHRSHSSASATSSGSDGDAAVSA
ncbi:hypothetical protein [Cellulosimicrobium sp. I38E]|uniref:hypothetical protein n=1 Tax=Cellulosimicrobium sp. I38E TaxID=1393139 RepID=UPI0012E89C07|nr:hypothetical protein [Cellulosimicrobium sp. I38E]